MRRVLTATLCLAVSLPGLAAAADPIDFAFLPSIVQPHPASGPLMDVARAGKRLVAVGERGVITYSDDNGQSWLQAAVPVSTTLTSVSFPDAENGWATGHGGVILHSADAGEHWQLQFDGRQGNAQFLAWSQAKVQQLQAQMDAAEPDSIEAQDLEIDLEDAQYAVEDAQLAVETGPVDPFLDVLMLDARRGFAVGAYGMLYSTADGGEHWKLDIDHIDNPDRYHYYAITAGADGMLYIAGEAGLLFRSEDSGEHWERLGDVYEGSLFGVLADGKVVLAFGLRGHLFRSDDQGDSWTEVPTDIEQGLYGGAVEKSGEILLFGAGGQVLRSDDGGHSFSARNHPSRATFASGLPDGTGNYLLVGMDGAVELHWEHGQHE